jgi:hypothetical protein
MVIDLAFAGPFSFHLFGRRTSVKAMFIGSAAALLHLTSAAAVASTFSIVVIPDTQRYSENGPRGSAATFETMTQWILDNRESRNIRLATHVGDVVENARDLAQWTNARRAMDRLDGQVPWAVLPGNHDLVDQRTELGSLEYQRNFGSQRFMAAGHNWFGGASPNNNATWQMIDVGGGQKLLNISLEWGTFNSSVGWAKKVIDKHAGMPTLITTHAYITDDAQTSPRGVGGRSGRGGNHGDFLWNGLIRDNPQIFAVVNGHFFSQRTEVALQDKGQFHQTSLNAAGQPVHEMLSNFQGYTDGGAGNIRLLTFNAATNRLEVETVTTLNPSASPTNARAKFDLALPDFKDPNRFPADPRVQTGTVTLTQSTATYISKAQPDAAFGTDGQVLVSPEVAGATQGLLKFSGLEQIPAGATIISARLVVNTTTAGDGAQFLRMNQAWDETVTWNTFAGDGLGGIQTSDAGPLVGEAFWNRWTDVAVTDVTNPGQQTVYPFGLAVNWDAQAGPMGSGASYVDVTESVDAWVNGAANNGWLVRAPFSTSENEPFFAGPGLPGFGIEFTTQPWAFASDNGTFQPQLVIFYSMVPEPGVLVLMSFGLVVVLAGTRLARKKAGDSDVSESGASSPVLAC